MRLLLNAIAIFAVFGATIITTNLISPTSYAYEFSHTITELFSFTNNISDFTSSIFNAISYEQ